MANAGIQRTAGALLVACLDAAAEGHAATIRVPQNYSTIQAAINAASNGDVILVSRGTWTGGLTIAGKTITLASNFHTTGDPLDISQTIIDGGAPILTIEAGVGAATTIKGLTFRNGDYQLVNFARRVNILNNRFINGAGDQVSFEGAGGFVRDCFFDNAYDDGIDSDDNSDPVIERNTIQNSGDDGIEVRLQGFSGPALEVVIRDNHISGAGEDGIQLIDYAGPSARTFRIEQNVIVNNADAGIGTMADGNSVENLAGAPMVEEVRIISNTLSGNPHGITGGDNMLVMNNIIVNCAQIGVKRVSGSSLVTYNGFWNNGTNYTSSNVNAASSVFQNPLLDANYNLQPGSPAIDEGAPSIVWNGNTIVAPPYAGPAPDLGANETSASVGIEVPVRVDWAIGAVRPNPAREGFAVAFSLPDDTGARIDVLDLHGRRVLGRNLAGIGRGAHVVIFPEARELAAGVYWVRLGQGGRSLATRVVVVK
ncbi:MAG TPA: right-handed parallel beta-helix repeat-containing protein [Candidatus Eisenbacteria bacterium]|nr:right-handed parallel beta-helix repeat-containing protein [Candidatus Eisenbacteria bacterium]